MRHNTLLHSPTPPSSSTAGYCASHQKHGVSSGAQFRVIPVTLKNGDRAVSIYALVDEGSELTLLDQEVADQLNVTGVTEELSMMWTGNISRIEKMSQRIEKLKIGGTNSTNKTHQLIGARTVNNLNLLQQTLNYPEMVSNYPYLAGLPIQDYKEVKPKLLIGFDNLNLTVPLKIREGSWGQPVALKCRLGWGITGRYQPASRTQYVGCHRCGTTCAIDELTSLVREFIIHDELIIKPTGLLESEEDVKAKRILEDTTKRIGSRFETGLLWKEDKRDLPPSLQMAKKRLYQLEKRLKKNSLVYDRVRQLIKVCGKWLCASGYHRGT